MGHVTRSVRRIVHVTVPRHLVTRSRRGHTVLPNAAVAQACQHKGMPNKMPTIDLRFIIIIIRPCFSGMDRCRVSGVLLFGPRVRHSPGPVQLQ